MENNVFFFLYVAWKHHFLFSNCSSPIYAISQMTSRYQHHSADIECVQCVRAWQMQDLGNLCTDTQAEMENKSWSWLLTGVRPMCFLNVLLETTFHPISTEWCINSFRCQIVDIEMPWAVKALCAALSGFSFNRFSRRKIKV